ncbi:MAG: HAD family hydrolase [Opitutales bacterium]
MSEPSAQTSASPGDAPQRPQARHSVGSGAPFHTNRVQTLQRIRDAAPGSVLLVDFDETLLQANSTQTFVRAARPYFFSALLFAVMEKLQPWNLLPADGRSILLRDWVRLFTVMLFFPWTLWLWRGKAAAIAQEWGNRDLIEALRERPDCRLIITSYGWRALLEPVLKAMDLPAYEVDACGLRSFRRDRLRGKPDRLRERIGEEALSQALLITDSPDDLDLAEVVDDCCLLQWDPQSSAPIFSHYVPFMYSVKAKYGNWTHMRSVVMADEFPLLVLCLSWLATAPAFHAAGLFLLVLSYWIIYELGYMENDRTAERKEKDPNLSDMYMNNRDRISFVEPWFWGILLAVPALVLVQLGQPIDGGPRTYRFLPSEGLDLGRVLGSAELWQNVGLWTALLVSVWAVFWIYNRIDKLSRTWLYLPMQFTKNFGFALVTPLSLVGYLVFVAHAMARWVTYFIYRFGRETYPGTSWFQRIRFFLLGSFALMALLVPGGVEGVLTWKALIIYVWLAIRARPFLLESIRDLRGVSKDNWAIKPPKSE